MTRLDEIKKRCRELIMAGVQLAILRHDLGDDDMDIEEIMRDAANAAEGIDTCDEEPIQEWTNLLSLVEKQAQTIQAIRELCLDPKEKDGCQTVASQVVRLCDEALEGCSHD